MCTELQFHIEFIDKKDNYGKKKLVVAHGGRAGYK
jgi:hypothetical protein